MDLELRRVNAVRLLQPLREGGSLPALVEADDDFKYVLKFRGAGHGSKALVAELIGGLLAKKLGFNMPELVFIDIDEDFGRTEPDVEVQDLLKQSVGLNLGLHFLSGSLTLDPYSNPIDETLASKIVWFDAFIANVDRTIKNTNMLVWNREPWLIDNGAALYFHHAWADADKAALNPFPYIKQHALLRKASRLKEVDQEMKAMISDADIDQIVAQIPDEWIAQGFAETPEETRQTYANFLKTRLKNSNIFVDHAIAARKILV